MRRTRPLLSGLEHEVMSIIWKHGSATAEQVGEHLRGALKNATVRTVLRRLEVKGYVSHRLEGRTYVYRPAVAREQAMAGAVRRVVDRFCGGSVEALLMGLLDARVVRPEELRVLSRRVARARRHAGKESGDGD